MNTTKVVGIAILGALIIFLGGILYRELSWNRNAQTQRAGTSLFSADVELVLEQEISPEDIEKLTLQYDKISNSVYFYESSGENIIIKEYRNSSAGGKHSQVQQQGGHLTIQGGRQNSTSFFLFGGYQNGYMEIYLPSNFEAEVSVKTSSGDIRSDLDFTTAGAFSASTASGDILLQNVSADKVQISTTSGDLSLAEITGSARFSSVSGDILIQHLEGSADISTTSGSIRLLGGSGDRDLTSISGDIHVDGLDGLFDLDTTSGKVSVSGEKGSGHISTVSGDVRLGLDDLSGDLSASTTSGDVSIQISEDASFYLKFSSTSGECRTFFDSALTYTNRDHHAEGSYGENTDRGIYVSTTSGDLRITK